jgi:septal ring factor EnvC (AmiA/AmiB activator)
MRFVFFSVLFAALILAGSLDAADLDANVNQLDEVRSRIAQAECALENNEASELKISRELALLTQTVARIDEKIAELSRKNTELQQQTTEQKRQLAQAEQQISKVGKRLEGRLVALYKEGDAGALRIIFSADSPTEMIQQYQYLTRIMEHDQQLLGDYRTAVSERRQSLAVLEDLEQQQVDLLAERQRERDSAKDGRSLQTRLLQQARSQKQQLKIELVQLKDQANRLKDLIDDLAVAPQESVVTTGDDIKTLKGKLSWPLSGRVIIGFGTQQDASLGTLYESNGIEIAAALKTPIEAVAAGQVVFADYFKGYGNLLILSHPGNFHTLYAQIGTIHKKVGDLVAAGEVLGYSGLGGRESIYFEIRSNGAPVNPLSWLKRR